MLSNNRSSPSDINEWSFIVFALEETRASQSDNEDVDLRVAKSFAAVGVSVVEGYNIRGTLAFWTRCFTIIDDIIGENRVVVVALDTKE